MAKHGDLITDGGVTWKVVDTRVHGYIAETPNFYSRSGLFTVSGFPAIYLTTPDRLLVNINGHGYIATSSTINLNSTSSWDSNDVGYAEQTTRAGKDFYIYACEQEGDVPKWVISSNSTCPTGYTENNSRKVGGFHCLCVSVGTIVDHPLSGYTEGMVLPLSIWDLRHRPKSEPEGMVWVKGINKWVDIYLASWSTEESKLVSIYQGVTADGEEQNGRKWSGEDFAEEFGLIGKHLPKRDDFLVFAKGSNETTAITGSTDAVQTGGHVDTAIRRMISNYGIEDCCGFLDQWTSDISSQSLYRARVGGDWGDSSKCGSRYVYFTDASSEVHAAYGARAASEPRRFE